MTQKSMNDVCREMNRINNKLEYLAVYGRASMAAFRQLSTHTVPPRSNVRDRALNTWSKV